jgi:hypothetical protein
MADTWAVSLGMVGALTSVLALFVRDSYNERIALCVAFVAAFSACVLNRAALSDRGGEYASTYFFFFWINACGLLALLLKVGLALVISLGVITASRVNSVHAALMRPSAAAAVAAIPVPGAPKDPLEEKAKDEAPKDPLKKEAKDEAPKDPLKKEAKDEAPKDQIAAEDGTSSEDATSSEDESPDGNALGINITSDGVENEDSIIVPRALFAQEVPQYSPVVIEPESDDYHEESSTDESERGEEAAGAADADEEEDETSDEDDDSYDDDYSSDHVVTLASDGAVVDGEAVLIPRETESSDHVVTLASDGDVVESDAVLIPQETESSEAHHGGLSDTTTQAMRSLRELLKNPRVMKVMKRVRAREGLSAQETSGGGGDKFSIRRHLRMRAYSQPKDVMLVGAYYACKRGIDMANGLTVLLGRRNTRGEDGKRFGAWRRSYKKKYGKPQKGVLGSAESAIQRFFMRGFMAQDGKMLR